LFAILALVTCCRIFVLLFGPRVPGSVWDSWFFSYLCLILPALAPREAALQALISPLHLASLGPFSFSSRERRRHFFGLCALVSRRPESLVLRAYCQSRVALAATDLVWSPSDAPTRGSRSQLEFFRRERPFPPRASRSCHLRPVPPLVFSIGCSPLRSPSLSLCGRLILLFLPHSVLVSLPSQETMTVL
jgi:hypothetical protein